MFTPLREALSKCTEGGWDFAEGRYIESAEKDFVFSTIARNDLPKVLEALDLAIEALERLSSPRAFCTARKATEEETSRMNYAADILDKIKELGN